MPDRSHTFAAYLRVQYANVFSRPWPVIPSALVIAALNVFLFAFDRLWTASDGIRNWGEWLFRIAGVLEQPDLLPPWLYSGSVLNLGLLLGGLSAALLSRQFGMLSMIGFTVLKVTDLKDAGEWVFPSFWLGAWLGGIVFGIGMVIAGGCGALWYAVSGWNEQRKQAGALKF